MNVNDRIALELGRAQMGRYIAEAALEQANAAHTETREKLADAEMRLVALEGAPTPDAERPLADEPADS